MSEHDAMGAAREEAARQAVYVAAMALAVPLLIWLERRAKDPDAWRTSKMAAAKRTERYAASGAAALWRVAEGARQMYESERP